MNSKSNELSNNASNFNFKNISLFIPRVFENITKERIVDIFENKMFIGKINHIDIVAVQEKKYNRVFIHFDYWFPTSNSYNIQKSLIIDNEESTKLYYDNLWYWLILENKKIPSKPNVIIQYDDMINMKTIENIFDEENGIVHYDEYDKEDNFSEYDEYCNYNEDDYTKMDSLNDELNYYENYDETTQFIHKDYVETLERKIINLQNSYVSMYYNWYNCYENYIDIYNLYTHNVSPPPSCVGDENC
jgi:hypothetical protein